MKTLEETVEKGVILVVDDIPTNLEVLLDVLARGGHETLVATDGESALEQADYALPDLILLDVMMPGIDGFETCRRLKANERTRSIPVIFMTALSETEDKVKGLEIGAVDYITKPLQHEEVIARVNTQLSVRQLQKGLEASNAKLREAYAHLDAYIDEIASLQRDLLPPEVPQVEGAQLACHWQSYDRAGGDYYDFVSSTSTEGNGLLGLFIADVSGHGPSAAVVVAMVHAWLRSLERPLSPAQLLTDLNGRFAARPVGDNYITALFGWYCPRTRHLVCARAGHLPPLLKTREGTITTLPLKIAPPLGVVDDLVTVDYEVQLQEGDTLLLYTDGLTEATNGEDMFLDQKGLEDIFARAMGDAQQQRDQLLEGIQTFEGDTRPSDDKALVLLHVTSP